MFRPAVPRIMSTPLCGWHAPIKLMQASLLDPLSNLRFAKRLTGVGRKAETSLSTEAVPKRRHKHAIHKVDGKCTECNIHAIDVRGTT